MTIPISIEQLTKLSTYEEDSTEVISWIKTNGLKNIFELSKFLEFPVFKERGFTKQVLRSWMGRKILSELSKTIIVPNDKNGIVVFNTIENLLDNEKEISTLDILKAIPNEEIKLDVDNLILIISSWKREFNEHKNLLSKLNKIEKVEKNRVLKSKENIDKSIKPIRKKLFVYHRKFGNQTSNL